MMAGPSHLFKLFVRREGLYGKIEANRYRQSDNAGILPKMEIYRTEEPMDYLVCQFDFDKSFEGFDFWNGYNIKWIEFLKLNGY